LTPSNYKVEETEKSTGLVAITYKEIIEWIRNAKIEDELEGTYLQYLLSYIEVLEMKPLSRTK
jgi:hypothetical protein